MDRQTPARREVSGVFQSRANGKVLSGKAGAEKLRLARTRPGKPLAKARLIWSAPVQGVSRLLLDVSRPGVGLQACVGKGLPTPTYHNVGE